jgi:hypothetical protein
MKILMEPTPAFVDIDGAPCRVWKGTTEGGNPVDVFVRCVGSPDPESQAEFLAALLEIPRPALSVRPEFRDAVRQALPAFRLEDDS